MKERIKNLVLLAGPAWLSARRMRSRWLVGLTVALLTGPVGLMQKLAAQTPQPGLNGEVLALAASGTNLYVGGNFTSANGVPATNIARWNGSSWSAVGTGINNGTVEALAVSGTNLYAGGYFTSAGGNAVTNIARWNGSSWSAVGAGINNGFLKALAVSGTNLYVGGSFTNAGGVAITNIAQWNGSVWSALGAGVNSNVDAIAVSGTNLFAGGYFTTAGTVTANGVAQWNGTSWSALGMGLAESNIIYGVQNVVVYALAVADTNLYISGDFTSAGGLAANGIAQWNGNSLSPLGLGLGFVGFALTVSGTNLYAAGPSTVAEWNGSSWSPLGSGFDYTAYALAEVGSNLYAAGYFFTAGGVPANDIAKWDNSAWSPLVAQADLSLSVTESPNPVNVALSNLNYTITVSNAGPATATDVTVSNQFFTQTSGIVFISATGGSTPTNGILLMNLGSLAPGATTTAQMTAFLVRVGPASFYTNDFQVYADQADPDTTNNVATAIFQGTGQNTTQFTTSSAEYDSNHITTVSQQVTNFSTELIAKKPDGTVLYDQTFSAPFLTRRCRRPLRRPPGIWREPETPPTPGRRRRALR